MRLEGTDPDGAGINEQKVNTEGQALVFSTNQSELEHESEQNGSGYNWCSNTVDPAIDDTVLLLKNTSDVHLHIDEIIISGDVNSEYTIHLPTTEVTPTGGAVVTGTNLNTTSSNVADATARSLETNNSQGDILYSILLLASTTYTIKTPGLIIGKNKSLGVDVVANTVLSSVTITGHYEV